ncbi:MAG: phosphodiester glycosidase family protein [Armatimonadota bacterium]|nr:phosphodiester glycosidase family protein [Armatimonadota bacterium]
MRKRLPVLIVLLSVSYVLTSCKYSAAWTTIGEGIEYQEFTTSDPNRLFVCRMARNNPNAVIDTTLANGYVKGGNTQIVRYQASLYDDAISWWGQNWGARNRVICAINGDFFNSNGITGGQCQSGWYVKRFGDWGGYSGFGWNLNRLPFFGGCVYHKPAEQFVTFVSTGATQQFHGINVSRGTNQLIIYTPHYSTTTPPATSGAEVLVELTQPLLIQKSPNYVKGYVKAVWQNSGSHYIPFDHIVLSADGTAATALVDNAVLGSEVRISQYPTDYNEPDTSGKNGCAYETGLDWNRPFAAVGVNYRFLENGVVRPPDPSHSGYAGLIVRNPRTAIAYNDQYVFFIVCDGRSTQSVGMTMTEMGNWCKNVLGATDGHNLDGGGSSTMVIRDPNTGTLTVKNNPSDGSERAVANGVIMVNLMPKMQSTRFGTGARVQTNTAGTNVRIGPGTNYTAMASLAKNTPGTVVEHSLNGVYAKGYYWWKVDFGTVVGWVAESLLSGIASPPEITEHPQPVESCPGGTATFRVRATGYWPMSFRWQKDGSDLVDGGRFSGVNTDRLTISNVEPADAGNYRCIVTNTYGTATSNYAALTLGPGMSLTISPPNVRYTKTGLVRYTLTYSNAQAITLSNSDIILHKTGTANANPWITGTDNITRYVFLYPSGDGTLSISVPPGTAVGCGTCPGAGPSEPVIVDNTPPGAVTVTDEGRWTPSLTSLSAWWTEALETGSGIKRYEYAIGTSPNTQDVLNWTSAGTERLVTASPLSLSENQTYYIQIRAVDNVDQIGPSASSDGITVAPGVERIGLAWNLPNGYPISLRNKTITAVIGDAFWLEEEDRTAAVKVVSSADVAVGDRVSVAGVLGRSGSQRALIGDVVHKMGSDAPVAPVGMTHRSLMSKAFNNLTPGVTGGEALYAIGLLVKCWGKVTFADSSDPNKKYFYIDDGTGLQDGSGRVGVKVYSGSIDPPTSGMVSVVGILSTEESGAKVVPVILVRFESDIEPLS